MEKRGKITVYLKKEKKRIKKKEKSQQARKITIKLLVTKLLKSQRLPRNQEKSKNGGETPPPGWHPLQTAACGGTKMAAALTSLPTMRGETEQRDKKNHRNQTSTIIKLLLPPNNNQQRTWTKNLHET